MKSEQFVFLVKKLVFRPCSLFPTLNPPYIILYTLNPDFMSYFRDSFCVTQYIISAKRAKHPPLSNQTEIGSKCKVYTSCQPHIYAC